MSAKRDFLESWARSAQLERAPTRAGGPRPLGVPESTGEGQLELAPAPLVPFADMDFWYLTEPLRWRAQSGSTPEVVVPKGFTTDFASVPSAFWDWMPPTGRYGYPAIVHDWLYWEQSVPRADADLVFKAALIDLGVSAWRRTVLYQSVNWFGGKYWDEDAAEKKAGHGRVLKLYPDDARITWADWRTRPGVFV